MASYQRFICMGNLTRNPELRYTPSGMAVCEFTVAVNGTRKDDAPYFGAVVVFGNTAEACSRYLGKGSQVLVDGKLKNDEWEDKNGQKRTKTRIMADTVQFIDRRENTSQSAHSGQNSAYTEQRPSSPPAQRAGTRQAPAPLPDPDGHRYAPEDCPKSDIPF